MSKETYNYLELLYVWIISESIKSYMLDYLPMLDDQEKRSILMGELNRRFL